MIANWAFRGRRRGGGIWGLRGGWVWGPAGGGETRAAPAGGRGEGGGCAAGWGGLFFGGGLAGRSAGGGGLAGRGEKCGDLMQQGYHGPCCLDPKFHVRTLEEGDEEFV